jgi:uncharacterized protein (UPF0548 family)
MLLGTKKPTRRFIDDFIAAQATTGFSYAHMGTSASGAPSGFVLDEIHTRLGAGQSTFTRAAEALRCWRHFDLDWVEICWPETPIEPGRTVAVLARVLGFWWLNACRIIEVIDRQVGPVRQFGFVYGTLADHAESGEERFCVTWNEDDSVWYSIRAFSRPNQWLPRLGYPLVRRTQKRFARQSSAAMLRSCVAPAPT